MHRIFTRSLRYAKFGLCNGNVKFNRTYHSPSTYSVYAHHRQFQQKLVQRGFTSSQTCSNSKSSPIAKDENPYELKEDEEEQSEILVSATGVKRTPFMPEIFTGHVDTDVLAYPEILDRVALKHTDDYIQRVSMIFQFEGKYLFKGNN